MELLCTRMYFTLETQSSIGHCYSIILTYTHVLYILKNIYTDLKTERTFYSVVYITNRLFFLATNISVYKYYIVYVHLRTFYILCAT